MVTVGFLHTSATHVRVFDELVADVDPTVGTVHVVEPALLDSARRAGPTDAVVAAGIERAIRELVDAGAVRIVCTCSTIGGISETLGRRLGVDLVRVDRAMAELAVAGGEQITVLATLESTIDPTVSLLRSVVTERDAAPTIDTVVVDRAWDRFEAGDLVGYHELVAEAIGTVGCEADVVVLAQASMAPAAAMARVAATVLSSPRAAVERLLAGLVAARDL